MPILDSGPSKNVFQNQVLALMQEFVLCRSEFDDVLSVFNHLALGFLFLFTEDVKANFDRQHLFGRRG